MIERVISGRYKILQLLGKGGVSSVYKGLHLKLNLHVAIKCIPKDDSDMHVRSKEVEILKQLKHPGLPIIYDVEEDDGYFYLVQEFVKGFTLTERLKQRGPISGSDAIKIVLDLIDVLEYLHLYSDGPIIHRDIKPDNIMLSDHGEVILIDFGIARTYNASQSNDTTYLGTAGFAAPEQYGKGQSDARTDIFAFGMTLYVLLTGDFDLSNFRCDHWEKETNLGSTDTDKTLLEIIRKSTQFHPEDRFDSVKSIRILLEFHEKSETVLLSHTETQSLTHSSGTVDNRKRMATVKRTIVGIKGSRPGLGVTYTCLGLAVALKKMGYTVTVVLSSQSKVYASLHHYFLGGLKNESLTDNCCQIDGITFYRYDFQSGLGNLLGSNCDYYLIDSGADEGLHQEWIRAHIRIMLLSSALWHLKANEETFIRYKALKDIRYLFQPIDRKILKSILSSANIPNEEYDIVPFVWNPFDSSEDFRLFAERVLGIEQDKKRQLKWPFMRGIK